MEQKQFGEHIPKSELVDGAYYVGVCRNSRIARWCAEKNMFFYWREKFGCIYREGLFCSEDFAGWDVFIPRKVTESTIEIPTEGDSPEFPGTIQQYRKWTSWAMDESMGRNT